MWNSSSIFTTARSAGQKGRGQNAAIKEGLLVVVVMEMLRIQSCDWSTRFMRVILRDLSLVSTNLEVLTYRCTVTGLQNKRTTLQLIQA